MLVKGKSIHFHSAIEKYTSSQDTIISLSTNLSVQDTILPKKDSTTIKQTIPLGTIRTIDLSQVDSILKRSEERERQIEIEKKQQEQAARIRYYKRPKDTTELLYKQFGIASFPLAEKLDNDPFQQNFFYNYSSFKPVEEKVNELVFVETQGVSKKNLKQEIKSKSEIEPEYIQNQVQFDWITILLGLSLLILGWVRLFSKKYLGLLVKSVISYQDANTLFREKNSLIERASFLINLLFLSNVSIFTLQLKNYFEIDTSSYQDYVLYLIVFSSLLALYIFRIFTTGFIGYVFLKQKVFMEYFHNVNIYTKNTALALFPIIIALQFLPYSYLETIIYIGIAIVTILYLLLYIRAFQIIIRKNVSIFYMILYLCAFEISPFLIVYKLLLSLG